jgi:hypothetical protein
MTHDEMIAVITHYKNGGKVEHKATEGNFWRLTEKPTWDFETFDYRAKTEPLVIYADFNEHGQALFCNREKYTPPFGRKLRKFVEVEE